MNLKLAFEVVDINIRPTEQEGGWDRRGREGGRVGRRINIHTDALESWGSYKAPAILRRCWHGAMAAVSGHGPPT